VSRVGQAIVGIDNSIAAALHSLVTPPVTTLLGFVTEFGSTAVLLAVTAVAAGALATTGARRQAALVVATFAGAQAVTWSLKAVFQRPRPSFDDPIATASSFSYPSGHALVSAAVYGVLAYLLLGRLTHPVARAACIGGTGILVAAIGFSRLYLRVHYLSDVLAGVGLGFASLALTTALFEWAGAPRAADVRRRLRPVRGLAIAAVVVLLAACGGGDDSAAPKLPQGDESVELDSGDFVARIDNPYWPMAPGSKWTYRGTGGERVVVTVTDRRKRILGIEATVVRDVESEEGEMVEDTYDWFAQDRWGNVWYLGEDTKEYENGEVVSTKGSWEAGVDGAYGGIVMPGRPEVGQAYRQEYYAGEAEDRGEVLSLDEQATVPFGSFDGLVMTKDTTPLEPNAVEHKYYAQGIGPILAVGVSSRSREELVRFEPG
jgi:membrane-associated phospholipid phosphatase